MATPERTQKLGDKIVSTVDTYLRKTPADVIFESNLLFGGLWNSDRMPGSATQKPAFKARPGRVVRRHAREMWIPVAVNRSTNTTAFTHADTLSTNIDDVMTVQRSNYAYYTDFAAISRQEYLENTGPEALIDRMQARVDMVFRTLSEALEADLWSTNDGSSTNPKEVQGLQHLVATSPTSGTVWNIDRSAYTWQRNQATAAGDTFANAGLSNMRTFFTTTAGTAGTDKASIIMTTPTQFNNYCAEAEGIHQITRDGGTVDLGYEFAVYRGIPITYSDQCLANAFYWLNMGYWYLCMPPGEDFATETYQSPPDQAMWKLWRVFLALQWGCERFDRQGVLTFTG